MLALRSLATVLVFFSDGRCRAELLDTKALLAKCRHRFGELWRRHCCGATAERPVTRRRSGVRFDELEECDLYVL